MHRRFRYTKKRGRNASFFVYDGDMNQADSGGRTEPQEQNQADSGGRTEPHEQNQADSGGRTEPHEQNQADSGGRTEPQEMNQTDREEGKGLHPSRLRRVTFLREEGLGESFAKYRMDRMQAPSLRELAAEQTEGVV